MREFSPLWNDRFFTQLLNIPSERSLTASLFCMEETLAVGWCLLQSKWEGAPCPKLCLMKKANIGNCHDTCMGLSHCRNWCRACHARMAVMSLERREEAVAGKRSSSVLVLSGREGERQRAQVTHQGQARSCWKSSGQNRSCFTSPWDCHTRPFTCWFGKLLSVFFGKWDLFLSIWWGKGTE